MFRVGPSANLPDCRAYELVSPPDKNGYDINFGNQAVAADGNSVAYESLGAFAGAPSGSLLNEYLSTRGPSGWTTVGISPPQNPGFVPPFGSNFEGAVGDLTRTIFESDFAAPLGGAVPDTFGLYLRQLDGSFQLLDPGEPPNLAVGTAEPAFRGASSDYAYIVFKSVAPPCSPNTSPPVNPPCVTVTNPPEQQPLPYDGSYKVYEWVNGMISLVSLCPGESAHCQRPNGTPIDGVVDQPSGAPMVRAVSADGSRVYWGDAAVIYLTQNGASTQIDLTQCTTNPNCSAGGPDYFWLASADGSQAFFTSRRQLTDDSTASSSGTGTGDLYAYDANTGHLTDITVDSHPADVGRADVQGVIGASSDGSYVYFVANGILAAGASSGSCGSGGSCNLYVWHHDASTNQDTTTFIATVDDADSALWTSSGSFLTSTRGQVSSDGLHLLFTSTVAPASGYDNAGHSEVYLYDAGSGSLTCVSCDPTGAPATGDALLSSPHIGVAQVTANLLSINNMSSDATRVFFETNQAMVPQDTNGTDDVYEWEANGTGACHTSGNPCLYLVSSGLSGSPSHFLDTTGTGNDVFILTREPLVGQDTDQNVDVYDARVGGGFPQPSPPPPPCSEVDCHGPPMSAPSVPVAATVTFFGPGNRASASPAAVAHVTVLTHRVRGTTFFIRVTVPRAGQITISGAGIGTARRFVASAGTYRIKITLTRKARSRLHSKGQLELWLHISYVLRDDQRATRTIHLTVRR